MVKNKIMGKKYGISFSIWRLLGVSAFKQKVSRKTGVPLTKRGMNEKVGRSIINMFFGK